MRFFGLLVLLLLCWISYAAQALEITTSEGLTYRQCAITRVEPDALRITHADGAARIPYEKLPSALQKQYFDAGKVMAYRQEADAARQNAAAKVEEERRQQEKLAEFRRQLVANQSREEEKQRLAAQEVETDRLAAKQRQAEEVLAEEKQSKATQASVTVILACVAIVVGGFIYFIPSIVGRHKTNAGAIFVLNFFWAGVL